MKSRRVPTLQSEVTHPWPMPLKAAEEIVGDKNSRWNCRSSWFITVRADLKAAGHRSSPIVGSILFRSLRSSPPLPTVQLLYGSCTCRRSFTCGAGRVVNCDVRASRGCTQGQRPSKPPPTTARLRRIAGTRNTNTPRRT
jgi:hypothetical protein